MSIPETAAALGTSPATVKRDWALASGTPYGAWIEDIANRLTVDSPALLAFACDTSPLAFCPNGAVTRAVMAILVRGSQLLTMARTSRSTGR